jgi:hypothetical protein
MLDNREKKISTALVVVAFAPLMFLPGPLHTLTAPLSDIGALVDAVGLGARSATLLNETVKEVGHVIDDVEGVFYDIIVNHNVAIRNCHDFTEVDGAVMQRSAEVCCLFQCVAGTWDAQI